MSYHPLTLDLAAYAAEYTGKSDRTLGVLLDSNVQVIRAHGYGSAATLQESKAKYRLLMSELHKRAWGESSVWRCELISRYAAFFTPDLVALERELQKAIDHRDCASGSRKVYREKLFLVRAELRDRELGNDQLPERDDLPEED